MPDDDKILTEDSYTSEERAKSYHKTQSGKFALSREGIVGYVSTKTERRTIKKFLVRVPHSRVLDIPAGSGKLAPIFADLNSSVLSCDISEEMLKLAKEEYSRLGYTDVDFKVVDAKKTTEVIDKSFDVVVCLRLLHRVPSDVQETVLKELSHIAPYSIVTLACSSEYTVITSMRNILKRLVGANITGVDPLTPSEAIKQIESAGFQVIDYSRTFPLSGQIAFLAKSTHGSFGRSSRQDVT